MVAIKYYFYIYVFVCATFMCMCPLKPEVKWVDLLDWYLYVIANYPTWKVGTKLQFSGKERNVLNLLLISPAQGWLLTEHLQVCYIIITHKSYIFSTLSSFLSSSFSLSPSLIAFKNTHSSTNITIRVVVLLLQGLIQVSLLWSHSVIAKLAPQEETRRKA